MYVALGAFIIMAALYLAAMPTFYNAEAVVGGRMASYASLLADLVATLKEFFAVQIFFWLALWAVKWSLLFMFRESAEGNPMDMLVWKGVFGFSVLSFVGCVITNFTSCSNMHAWFAAGMHTLSQSTPVTSLEDWIITERKQDNV